MGKLIEIKELVTNFNTYEGVVKALNGVSLSIDQGITFGLVGESGCGKSVTARSIMRLIQPPGVIVSGEVLFFDDESQTPVDLLQQSEAYMRDCCGNKISMIFQEPNAALNPTFTIGEQVSESFLFHQVSEMSAKILDDLSSPADKTVILWKSWLRFCFRIAARNPGSPILKLVERIPLLKGWKRRLKKEAIQRSIDIIGQLHIPNPEQVVNNYPHNLSGGMKQRIVIAIALACHPVLLIADEATSNLDVTVQAQILELLVELKKTVISSILLITHDLGVVAETCDRVGVMYAGSLCEVADVKDIFERPLHPYTRALLNSVPKKTQTDKLYSIEGSVPNLVTPPSGCRFHPRCPLRIEICDQQEPDLVLHRENHLVACHAISEEE